MARGLDLRNREENVIRCPDLVLGIRADVKSSASRADFFAKSLLTMELI